MLMGDRIRFLRLLKGSAQYDLVDKSGKQNHTSADVAALDSGRNRASLQKIATALETTPEWLEEGTAPVFTKSLLIADPLPEKLSASLRPGIVLLLKELLSSFFASNHVSGCVSILVSPRLIVNVLLLPGGSLLLLLARNRTVKIIQSAIRRSGCACSFIDSSKNNFDISCLLQQDIEKGAESLRELLKIAALTMHDGLDVERYLEDYRSNGEQDKWGFSLTAYVSKKGGLTRGEALDALQGIMTIDREGDTRIEITGII